MKANPESDAKKAQRIQSVSVSLLMPTKRSSFTEPKNFYS